MPATDDRRPRASQLYAVVCAPVMYGEVVDVPVRLPRASYVYAVVVSYFGYYRFIAKFLYLLI
jgi:hypothetical protein